MNKRAFFILLVSLIAVLNLSAKSSKADLRFGFEAGFGTTTVKAETVDTNEDVRISDNGFFADGVLEYRINDEWTVKTTGGVQYQRKAETEIGDEKSRLDEKTGLLIEASVMARYSFYNYSVFSLYFGVGAEGTMGIIAPVTEDYSKDTLTNIGLGVAAEVGSEIEVAARSYMTIGIKGAYMFYNTTKLAEKNNGSLKNLNEFIVRPYIGFSYKID